MLFGEENSGSDTLTADPSPLTPVPPHSRCSSAEGGDHVGWRLHQLDEHAFAG
jgi:hypothetical protein